MKTMFQSLIRGSLCLYSFFKLDNVFHVPSFQFNLLSVHKITQSLNCLVTFFPNICIFQDLSTKKAIGVARECDGLYYLDTSPSFSHASLAMSTLPIADLWHYHLGHSGHNILPYFSSLNGKILFNKCSCTICPKAKPTRLPFSISSISSWNRFVLFCFIWIFGVLTPLHLS